MLPSTPQAADPPQMAARLAQDIPEGWYVNLGIGAPLRSPTMCRWSAK